MSGPPFERFPDESSAVQDLRGEPASRSASAGSRTAEPRCALGICDGSGFLVDEATNTATDCECRAARIAAARTRTLEGRLPRRYRGVSFERPPISDLARTAPDQIQRVRRYTRSIGDALEAGRGMWIVGDVGTGKTSLAMLVSRTALDAGRSVAIYSLPRLLNLLRESLESPGGLIDLLDRLAAVDLLHIDDLGAENQTDWVLEQLYSIVNSRYESERAIVTTSNLMPDELSDRLGARTVSRLEEICGEPIPLFGEDRRQVRFEGRGAVAEAPPGGAPPGLLD